MRRLPFDLCKGACGVICKIFIKIYADDTFDLVNKQVRSKDTKNAESDKLSFH